ncbi:MAG: hypothetical protein SGPRY_005040 [Prymnesium sp.]
MAMFDQASPERIMIGGDESWEGVQAVDALAALYAMWVPRSKIIASGLWSAELSKLTANAFLAQRVSSINAISALCENTGADVNEVSFAIGVDSRIGRKGIQASVGFGGACYEARLPTHLRNLVYLCKSYRLPAVATYWEHVIKMNDYQKSRFAKQIVSAMFNTVSGKKMTVLGFAYKKNTSDIRFSPAIDVCKTLIRERAALTIVDPQVASQAIKVTFGLPLQLVGMTILSLDRPRLLSIIQPVVVASRVDQPPHKKTRPPLLWFWWCLARGVVVSFAGAHALIVLTDWDEFARLDYYRIYEKMQKPAFVFDGRNILDHEQLREIGFLVYAIGKPGAGNVVNPDIAERTVCQMISSLIAAECLLSDLRHVA